MSKTIDIDGYKVLPTKVVGEDRYANILVGPAEFECMLGEAEDATWRRDGAEAVARLNDMHKLLVECLGENISEPLRAKIAAITLCEPYDTSDWEL